jgi:hypothetical protein
VQLVIACEYDETEIKVDHPKEDSFEHGVPRRDAIVVPFFAAIVPVEVG